MFKLEDIQDIRIIIKANNQHWSLVPKDCDSETASKIRLSVLEILFDSHVIADKPLKEIRIEKQPEQASDGRESFAYPYHGIV